MSVDLDAKPLGLFEERVEVVQVVAGYKDGLASSGMKPDF